MNISWKFEEIVFINNKVMSARTCVCNCVFKHDVINIDNYVLTSASLC